jgi:hypothetical protein
MMLGQNHLQLVDPVNGDINYLWDVLPGLQYIDLNSNGWLGALNVSVLTDIRQLDLANWNSQILTPSGQLNSWGVLTIPNNSLLNAVTVSGWPGCLWFDIRQTPLLNWLNAAACNAPFELWSITYAPLLQNVLFDASGVNSSSTPVPEAGNRCCGELTQYIFHHLNHTNPVLAQLLVDDTPLNFGPPDPIFGSNVPVINGGPTLWWLGMSQLPQLVTGEGPNPLWLAGVPALLGIDVHENTHMCLNTSAFEHVALTLSSVTAYSTCVIGDLTPLYRLRALSELQMDDSGIDSRLPSNVSAVWPALTLLQINRCALSGPIPDFALLPHLMTLTMSSNVLEGAMPESMLKGAQQLNTLILSQKSVNTTDMLC